MRHAISNLFCEEQDPVSPLCADQPAVLPNPATPALTLVIAAVRRQVAVALKHIAA